MANLYSESQMTNLKLTHRIFHMFAYSTYYRYDFQRKEIIVHLNVAADQYSTAQYSPFLHVTRHVRHTYSATSSLSSVRAYLDCIKNDRLKFNSWPGKIWNLSSDLTLVKKIALWLVFYTCISLRNHKIYEGGTITNTLQLTSRCQKLVTVH